MSLLEAAGYETFRSAGSHGVWDVIGISDTGVVLVQVKVGVKPTPAERERMRVAKCPPNAMRLLHYYTKGKHAPQIYGPPNFS